MNLTKECKFVILYIAMAHYSSHDIYYEGGAKNPSKSTSVKLLVLALVAQTRVSAENEGAGHP